MRESQSCISLNKRRVFVRLSQRRVCNYRELSSFRCYPHQNSLIYTPTHTHTHPNYYPIHYLHDCDVEERPLVPGLGPAAGLLGGGPEGPEHLGDGRGLVQALRKEGSE